MQRVEQHGASWRGEEPLWLVAPHMPEWLVAMRRPVCFAPGCYWVEPLWQRFLWIAANELPLRNELIPFLMARSGRALDAFGRWIAPHRTIEWVLNKEEGVLEGRLEGQLAKARAALRRVLTRRQLAPSKDDDARIDACNHLETLRRWHDQAVTAASVADALA